MGDGSRRRSPLNAVVPLNAAEPEPALASSPTTGPDSRVVAVWCEWLDALATDAEAALAAAMAYKALDDSARDHWLGALEHDMERVRVPRIALYAPLLAVESDPERRARIAASIGPIEESAGSEVEARALMGIAPDGTRVAVLVCPLYLDFVQVLACGFKANEGFTWVRHDPIVRQAEAPYAGDEVVGVPLDEMPLGNAVDELALVVLAHTRSGRELPEAVKMFADLFGPVCVPPSSVP